MAGATGVDILDGDKNWLVPDDSDPGHGLFGRNERTFSAGNGAHITEIDGPVRAIREYMGANRGPFTSKRHVFYESRQDVTTFLRLHGTFDGPDDVQDYSPAALGMTYRNDLNQGGVTIDGRQDAVKLGDLAWEQVTGAQGTFTIVHDFRATQEGLRPTSFYDDAGRNTVYPQCTGDDRALGVSGLSITERVHNTDPAFGQGGRDKTADLRVQYYDVPNQGVQDAKKRDAWVRKPLQASVTPFGR